MAGITPWAYRRTLTPLHKLPAGLKLVFFLSLSIASFFPGTGIKTMFILTAIILILLALSLIARIGPLALLKGSGPLLLLAFGLLLFKGLKFSPPGFNIDGLKESLVFCVRIIAAFASSALLFSVTTPAEIQKSLSRLEAFFRLKKQKPALYLAMMLRFLPLVFAAWEDLNLAWKSRGGKNSLTRLTALIPLLIERMLLKAAGTAEAMEARSVLH